MNDTIVSYNKQLSEDENDICILLASTIEAELSEAESKIWHAHPVWFLEGNPIVGYSKQKAGIRLMFWSGRDFDEKGLVSGTGRFKDASVTYTAKDQIDPKLIERWLKKSRDIQWDYKNIVRNKGVLKRLK